MPRSGHRPVGARWYRLALLLYPPRFRREFGDELLRQFSDARRDALDTRRPIRSLAAFHLHVAGDVAWTLPVQWLRSGWPLIVIAAMSLPLMAASSVVSIVQQVRFGLPTSRDDEVVALVLLVSVLFAVIAITIVLTVWFASPQFTRRPPERRISLLRRR